MYKKIIKHIYFKGKKEIMHYIISSNRTGSWLPWQTLVYLQGMKECR